MARFEVVRLGPPRTLLVVDRDRVLEVALLPGVPKARIEQLEEVAHRFSVGMPASRIDQPGDHIWPGADQHVAQGHGVEPQQLPVALHRLAGRRVEQ